MFAPDLPPKLPSEFPIEDLSRSIHAQLSAEILNVVTDTLPLDSRLECRSFIGQLLRSQRALRSDDMDAIIITTESGVELVNICALFNLMVDCSKIRSAIARNMDGVTDSDVDAIIYEELYFHIYGALSRTGAWRKLSVTGLTEIKNLESGQWLYEQYRDAYIEAMKRIPESELENPNVGLRVNQYMFEHILDAIIVGLPIR